MAYDREDGIVLNISLEKKKILLSYRYKILQITVCISSNIYKGYKKTTAAVLVDEIGRILIWNNTVGCCPSFIGRSCNQYEVSTFSSVKCSSKNL